MLAAKAGAAARIHHQRARFHEGLDVAARQGLHVDLLGGGHHDRPGPGVDLAAAEVVGDDGQVFDPAVGATADEHLVEQRAFDHAQVLDVVDRRRAGDLRLQRLGIDFDHASILGAHRV